LNPRFSNRAMISPTSLIVSLIPSFKRGQSVPSLDTVRPVMSAEIHFGVQIKLT
jgi:hypothetical protein